MKIWQDGDGDLWAEHANGTLICVAELLRHDVAEDAEPGRPFADAEKRFGPLVELVPKATEA